MRKCIAALGAILILSNPAIAQRDTPDCHDAIDKYNSAVDDISSALRRYSSCVSDSRGRDDCSSEFGHLKSAQSDFEDAVSAYGNECE